jgi:hypothetical protein
MLDSRRSNSSNLIVFGRTLLKALNKLHRQKANCSANLDTLDTFSFRLRKQGGNPCR